MKDTKTKPENVSQGAPEQLLNPKSVVRTLIDHSKSGGPILDITEEVARMEPTFAQFREEERELEDLRASAPWVAEDGFDWSKDENVTQRGQRAIATYENELGDIVIRGQQIYPDEDSDPFLVIGKDSLDKFIERLRSFL